MYNLLIVDDDTALLEVNRIYFSSLGFKIYTAETAKDALMIVDTMTLDCIILDVSLPDFDGFEVCTRIKSKSTVPIIFLSNYTREDHRIHGFLAGGDDYLTKPYSLKELELRIYARIQKQATPNTAVDSLRFDDLIINATSHTVFYKEYPILLTVAEFDIFWFLAKHQNTVFSQLEIYEKVWEMPDLGAAHTVQVHIAQLRRKINSVSKDHCYIQTVWGKGYKFVP
ncbi:MAG: response regulator transcription factor [Eubacterium sp.]